MQQEHISNTPSLFASYDNIYDPIYDVAYGVGFVFYEEEDAEEVVADPMNHTTIH